MNRDLTAAYLWCAGLLEVQMIKDVRECGLPIYGGSNVCWVSVYGDVKIIQSVVSFCFCCELQFWMQGIRVIKDHLYAGVVGVEY